MRKLFALGFMLAIAATLVGCGKKSKESSGSSDNDGGNSREKIVQNFCEALRSCDEEFLWELLLRFRKDQVEFADGDTRKKGFLEPLREMAKSKEPVKTKVLISATIENTSASIIKATCEDVDTLYFYVGYRKKEDSKDKVDKIIYVTADKEKVDRDIKEIEELESKKGKTRSDDVKRVGTSKTSRTVKADYKYSSCSARAPKEAKSDYYKTKADYYKEEAKSADYARPVSRSYGPTNAASPKAYYK